MKKLIIVLSGFLLLSFAFCKTKEKGGATTTKENAGTCDAKISFGSPGTGIDSKSYDAIIALIDGKKLKYTQKNLGREGEKEICLSLAELKKSERSDFIEQLKKIAVSGQFVSVSVN